MQKSYSDFIETFNSIIASSGRILITSHMRPDDDSISSVLAMYYYLTETLGKARVDIIYSGEIQQRWNYFKSFEKIHSTDDIASRIDQYDVILCLDGSQFSRFSSSPQKIIESPVKKICIDHHASPVDTFDTAYIDSDRTSCAEVVYQLFFEKAERLEPATCETLLLGIMGDTGTFKFIKPEQSSVFQIVERLVHEGNINIQLLKSRYEGFSQKAFQLIQKLVNNSSIIHIQGVPDFLNSHIDSEEIEKEGYTGLEANEAAHIFIHMFGLSIHGVSWGMVLYPLGQSIKVSMRSRPESTNVRIIAEGMGRGGGHDRAAGMTFTGMDPVNGMEQTIEEIRGYLIEKGVKLT